MVHEGEAKVARLLGFEGIEPLALGQVETAEGGNVDELLTSLVVAPVLRLGLTGMHLQG